MALATDRDLLVLEPALFRQIAWTGQTLVSLTDGTLSGTSLTSATGGFEDAGVESGHVVLVNSVALEVVSRDSDAQLTISRLRDTVGDLAQPTVLDGSPLEVKIHTFTPQLQHVHEMLLRSVEIDPASTTEPVSKQIVNTAALARLEAIGAMHLILSAAGASSPVGSELHERTEIYRKRFASARGTTPVELDTSGDGQTDTIRRFTNAPILRG
ncbi:MAG: hypothetical protein ACYTF7_05925 [Planctomycetota bacterium]|jgi:hypothetical protein